MFQPVPEAADHKRFSASLPLDDAHRTRLECARGRICLHHDLETPAYFASLYLLTANEDLYRRSSNCFCRGSLELDYATVRGISAHNYALLSAAKCLYSDRCGLMLTDLTSQELFDSVAFSLILNAILIARYGPAVLSLRERRLS